MKPIAIALLLLCSAASASCAGSLAWTVTTAAGSQTFSADISDADIARIIAAGRPLVGLTQETSDADVEHALIKKALADLIEQTVAYEQRQASMQAQQAVPTIVATPQE